MNNILRMLVQRFSLGILTLFIVSIIIFLGVSMLPGDAAQAILGQAATPETIAVLRKQLGLDLPAHVRYLSWLGGIVQGDFGTSIGNGREIGEIIGIRFFNTIFLAAFAACISVPLALVLGILAALYRNSYYDRSINAVTLSSISTPEFFVAYVLILFVSVKFGWLPSLANVQADTGFLVAPGKNTITRSDTDPGISRLHDAHDSRCNHQPVVQLLYRNGNAQRYENDFVSLPTMPYPMPGRLSSMSLC